MGLLDRLRGGGTTHSVEPQPAEAVPGGTVDLRDEVGGELDDKCRAIRAGVTCIGSYIVEERGRDANGHPIMREVGPELTLHEEERKLPLQLGPGQAQFMLPENAPPSPRTPRPLALGPCRPSDTTSTLVNPADSSDGGYNWTPRGPPSILRRPIDLVLSMKPKRPSIWTYGSVLGGAGWL